jgi:hypothetical protein
LSSGAWQVEANAGGIKATGEVEIEPGMDRATLDLDFGGGHSVQGEVFLNGRPVDGARVVLMTAEGTQRGATTDPAGSFRVEGLDSGPHVLLITDLDSGFRHVGPVDVARDEPLRVHVETGSIHGTVADAEGNVLRGVEVAAEELLDSGAEELPALARQILRRQPTQSDSRGVFRLDALQSGTWRLSLEVPGFAAWEQNVLLEGGADVGPMQIRLRPLTNSSEQE